jgi:surfeit locus 1 family protein
MNIMAAEDAAVRRLRRFTAPVLWPTVAALPAFIVLLGLGTWQVQRLHWKEALIAARDARLAAPPIALDDVRGDPASQEFRRVRASGGFVPGRDMFLEARTRNGEAGYHLVSPLALASGGVVLVDRGWVRTRAAAPAPGTVTMDGVIRKAARPSAWTPDNVPARDLWFYVDVPQMAAAKQLRDVKPFFLDTGPPPEIPNNHLQYAVTWYGLAAALAAIYAVLVARKIRR